MKDLGVLVVVDDRSVLSVIERMFSHFKASVDCAMSASEAFDRLKTKEYRTMITDLGLPETDGFELARKARELFPSLNVILFSGHTMEQLMNLILAPKVSEISEEYLKPCGFNDMLQGIMNKETGKTFLLE